jgi:hypothetical protein
MTGVRDGDLFDECVARYRRHQRGMPGVTANHNV